MQPRDRLTAKEIQVAILVWQGLTNEDICRGTAHQRAGGEELPAHRLRQSGSVDPAGTRALCGRPRRGELAYASGQWAVAPGGRVEHGPSLDLSYAMIP